MKKVEKTWKAEVVPCYPWGEAHTHVFVWAVVFSSWLFLPSSLQS